eukprot:COSAG01_NODE_25729_length_735_cov_1.281447_2_plen_136_part_00
MMARIMKQDTGRDFPRGGKHCTNYQEIAVDTDKEKSTFLDLLLVEQQDILDRVHASVLEMHPNIAHNGALLENVFTAFVCIQVKLPVFIVGKPGNSKSLAMQLLNSSLVGSRSTDNLFKQMPGAHCLPAIITAVC